MTIYRANANELTKDQLISIINKQTEAMLEIESEITTLKQRESKLVEALKDLIVLAPQAHDFNDKCFYRGIPPNAEWFCGCGTDDKIKKCVEVLKELGVDL